MRSASVIIIYALIVLPFAHLLALLVPSVPFWQVYAFTFWSIFALFIAPSIALQDDKP